MDLNPLYDSFKSISHTLKDGDIVNLGVDTNNMNVSHDIQKNIDLISNNLIKTAAQKIPEFMGIVSEEDNKFIIIRPEMTKGYVLIFDPLDGSKNVMSNITVGTIYGIYEYDREQDKILSIYESGYALYGPSTLLVRTVKNTKVEQFCLNKDNDFVYTRNLSINTKHSVCSINMAYKMDKDIQSLIQNMISNGCTQRWCGAMVADVHQVIMRGGTFIYPQTKQNPSGKIRILYEAIPMSHIFNVLGGCAVDINSRDILEQIHSMSLNNNDIHGTIDIILSSSYTKDEIKDIMDINDLMNC